MRPSHPETPAGTDRPVTIISVCYNSAAVIESLLASVPDGVAVILVDNGSRDLDALRRRAEHFGARLIALPENIGYGRACNAGAAGVESEFLFFLNPDTVLRPGALDALVAAARRHGDAVAMNPALRNRLGREEFKRGSVLLPRSTWLPRGWPPEDRAVPVLSGAALFVRRSAFEAVGGFDPRIFLYHEDDDLALRLARRGRLMFVRAAEVQHANGASSGNDRAVAALKGWHMGQSRVYATEKYGRTGARWRALAQAAGQILSPLTLVSARKRAKQWAFLRGVWRGHDLPCRDGDG